MIKPDLIVSWPRTADYPLWREFIRENRTRFDRVIIVFTETFNSLYDFTSFVMAVMLQDNCIFIDSPAVNHEKQDWRNVAIHAGLGQSFEAEWVWFTEQDFLPKDGFWEAVESAISAGEEVIGVKSGDRLHPCCLLIKKSILIRTCQDFGIRKDISDHFSMIQRSLEGLGVKPFILSENLYSHMAGTTANLMLVMDGKIPNYKPEEYLEYLNKCLKCKIPLHQYFIGAVRDLCTKYSGTNIT